jgi:hypothetical protein
VKNEEPRKGEKVEFRNSVQEVKFRNSGAIAIRTQPKRALESVLSLLKTSAKNDLCVMENT